MTLYQGIGRFSISCLAKGQNGIAVPLLSAQDPRTTTLSVVVGNKIYRMGESSGFSEKVEKIPGGRPDHLEVIFPPGHGDLHVHLHHRPLP